MKFETLKPADAGLAGNGTHLEGHVSAYYHELVEAFGQPTYDSGGDKTTVECGHQRCGITPAGFFQSSRDFARDRIVD